MSPDALLAGLLAIAVLIGAGRLILWQFRAPAGERARGWRFALLLSLQPVCAALLYCTLLPPRVAGRSGTIKVATRHAPRLTLATGDRLIALPEAPAIPGAERVPDLATALRRYPGTRDLRIVGEGLEPRDRDAVQGVGLAFDPTPLPRGLIGLDVPTSVAPGAAFRIGARVHQVAGGSAELLDPAGRRVDAQPVSATGDVVLGGTARGAGLALFKLRLRDAARTPLEDVDVPVATIAPSPPRVLLLAAAPGPEVKYLRRWAADAGLSVRAQFETGGGVQLGDPPVPLNAATFQRLDLVILDDRSWAAMAPGERGALIDAVRGGLGMLLRITGPLPDATRRQWRALGLSVSAGADTVSVQLMRDADSILTRRSIVMAASDGVPVLRDVAGQPLAIWRAEGRGRIALTSLVDSFALVLSGQGDRHAELWSDMAAIVSRAQPGSPPHIDPHPRTGQRIAICGTGVGSRVVAPGGAVTPLLFDPAPCAAYWPLHAGWHMLHAGERDWPLFVRPPDAAPGLRAAETREATLRLVAEPAAERGPTPVHRGASWPWFLGWLAASGALWWFERRRVPLTP